MVLFRRFAALLALFLLFGCTASKQPQQDDFLQNITPITQPTLFTYTPCKKISLLYESKTRGSGINNSQSIYMDIASEKSGNGLLWKLNVTKMKINNKSIDFGLPIFSFNCMTDYFGNILSKNFIFPGLASKGFDIKPGTKQYAEFEALADKYTSTLRGVPIVTGDKFIESNLDRLEGFTVLNGNSDASPILKGYSTYKGKKVIVAEVRNDDIKMMELKSKLMFTMAVQGHVLYDALTVQPVYMHCVMDMSTALLDEHITSTITLTRIN